MRNASLSYTSQISQKRHGNLSLLLEDSLKFPLPNQSSRRLQRSYFSCSVITASVFPECQGLLLNKHSVELRYSRNQAGDPYSTEKVCITYFIDAAASSRPSVISVRHGFPPAVSTHLRMLVCTKLKRKNTTLLKCIFTRDPACSRKLKTPAIITNR